MILDTLVSEEVVDVPVNVQPQVPAVRVVPRIVEFPQTKLIDRVVDFAVVRRRLLLTVRTVQQTEEISQVRSFDKVDMHVAVRGQAPMVQTA